MISRSISMLRACGTLGLGILGGMISFAVMRSTVVPPLPAADPPMQIEADPEDPLLQQQVEAVDFENVKLSDALASFGRSQNLNIVCKWDALKDCKLNPDELITLHVKKSKISRILDSILAVATFDYKGSSDYPPGWIYRDGAITISNQANLDAFGPIVERLYDVRPLMVQAQEFSIRFPTSTSKAMQNIFQFSTIVPGTALASTERALADNIQKFITDNVATASWKDNGGNIGWISYAGDGKILIGQTEQAHFQIQRLLHLLQSEL